MAAADPNQRVNAAIAALAGVPPAPGAEPWLNLPGVQDCFAKCDFDDRGTAAHVNEGFNTMVNLTKITTDKFADLADRMAKRTGRGANGPVRIPHLMVRNGQGLIHWARTRHRLGQSLDSRLFTQQELDEMSAALEAVDERAARGDDTAPSKPGKFVPDKWVQWDKAFNACPSSIP